MNHTSRNLFSPDTL